MNTVAAEIAPSHLSLETIDLSIPLVLDLDGTLISTDLLHELAIAYLLTNTREIVPLVKAFFKGRSHLKSHVARSVTSDIDSIPASDDLVTLAAGEAARGRRVVVATAANELLAQKVMDRFPFIEGFFASTDALNLKGQKKADALQQAFPDGFIYVGDSMADMPVWRAASHSIVVSRFARVQRHATAIREPVLVLSRPSILRAGLRAARIHQWAKNCLVFVPALLSSEILSPKPLLNVFIAFIALSIGASATYLLNDIIDLQSDRGHWTKRNRPIASGDLPILVASAIAMLGIPIAVAIAFLANKETAIGVLVYILITCIYSCYTKRIAILDCLNLAGLFSLRLAVGAAAAGVYLSSWLVAFSMFLFTSLAFAKRYTELMRASARGIKKPAGRGYLVADLNFVLIVGLSSGLSAIIIMILYIAEEKYQGTFHGMGETVYSFPCIIAAWILRVWLLNVRGELNDDPVQFALKDRTSLLLGAILLATVVVGLFGLW